MKKTLIALALVATAVSGSAMAWTPNGLGGTMEFGGTLTPKDVVNPWEVKMGTGTDMNTLNGSLKPNEKVVNITLSKSVPFLGIRTVNNKGFYGAPGISPKINYGNVIDVANFVKGEVPFSIDVNSTATPATKIGTLTTKLTAVGVGAETGDPHYNSVVALEANSIFRGGLPQTRAEVMPVAQAKSVAAALFSDIAANFDTLSLPENTGTAGSNYNPTNPLHQYSAYYASGLQSGASVTITLDSPAAAGIVWKANFPITVSYQ
ncbi:TPA: hypothetical protein NPB33_004207 [Salmonella enterica subsp. enterica serovar Kintambo]|nr:hypothetical protein [Salmonella enterica subsp. enterica serovar Kintambo]EIJ8715632.1 hypothetical protein [Salmonella enterica]HCI4751688.1 hypothetical protein [Salmonella enterica subsp. enterica serovar Kintambo]